MRCGAGEISLDALFIIVQGVVRDLRELEEIENARDDRRRGLRPQVEADNLDVS